MKKILNEFKEFALKGNVLDLAVGVIIGGAFTTIVTSLTDNFINPILKFITAGDRYTWQDIGGFASDFITAVINFLITAVVLFCIVKAINKMLTIGKKPQEEAPAAPTTKKCPYCMSEIDLAATRCPQCTSLIEISPEDCEKE